MVTTCRDSFQALYLPITRRPDPKRRFQINVRLWGLSLRTEDDSDYISGNTVAVECIQPLTDREAFRMTGPKLVYHLSVMIGSG